MATARTIATEVTRLFSCWGRNMPAGTIEAFATVLGTLSDEQLAGGMQRAIEAAGEHPPNAGALLRLCRGTDRQSIEAKAAAAWEWCEKHASLETNPRSANDPLLRHAIGALGGWNHFCTKPINEWDRRTFIAAYVAAAENPQLEEVAKLSHNGEPLGQLAAVRKQLAESLAKPHPLRNAGGQLRSPQPSDERRFQAEELQVEAARLKRHEPQAIPF
jgi:hypothetical protein